MLARRLYEFFWQFIDPKRISMSVRDERIMISAVELLQYMGTQAAIFDHDLKTIQEVVKSLEWFHETGTIYRRAKIRNKVFEALRSISEECKSWIGDAPRDMKAAIKYIESKTNTLNQEWTARD